MTAQHVDTAMIVGCYLAIIGLYIYTFKATQQVRDMVFKHRAEKDIHVNSKDVVYKDVCDERMGRIDDKIETIQSDITEIKTDITEINTGLNKGFGDIKTLLMKRT